jgi:hypothetical protein
MLWQVQDDRWRHDRRWLGAATARARARETTRERMGKEKAGRMFILVQHVGDVSALTYHQVRYLDAMAYDAEQRVQTQK